MLDRPDLTMAATTVRVPVLRAHSEAVFFETKRPTDVRELHEAFGDAEGIVLYKHGIVTPHDVEDTDQVHIARVRPEPEDPTSTRFQNVDRRRSAPQRRRHQRRPDPELLIAQGRVGP